MIFVKHFRDIDKRLETEETEIAEQVEEDDLLRQDPVLKQVLIQRSRKYIKDGQHVSGTRLLFPKRVVHPTVEYSLRRVYRTLYDELQNAFDRHEPFLNLSIYNTVKYHKNPEKQIEQRQKQVIGLIRTLVLKRLESSWRAFEVTVENLLLKMADWLKRYAPERFEMWEGTNRRWWRVVQEHIRERLHADGSLSPDTPENLQQVVASNPSEEEDDLAAFEHTGDFTPDTHDADRLFDDVVDDMNFLTSLLSRIYRLFYADQLANEPDTEKDDKLQQLLNLLKKHPNEKLLLFTEFLRHGSLSLHTIATRRS